MSEDKKYILISMEDARAKKLAEVLGNASCKKIIDFLANQEDASEKDIADALKMPLNTVEYNLKKLLEAELIEKAKNYFWSQKGKKIVQYKLSNKSIIISPSSQRVSSKLKSILPVAIIAGIGAVTIRYYYSVKQSLSFASEKTVEYAGSGELAKAAAAASELGTQVMDNGRELLVCSPSVWMWFLTGALLAVVLFAILNWRKL